MEVLNASMQTGKNKGSLSKGVPWNPPRFATEMNGVFVNSFTANQLVLKINMPVLNKPIQKLLPPMETEVVLSVSTYLYYDNYVLTVGTTAVYLATN